VVLLVRILAASRRAVGGIAPGANVVALPHHARVRLQLRTRAAAARSSESERMAPRPRANGQGRCGVPPTRRSPPFANRGAPRRPLLERINGQRREDRNDALPLLALLANELDRAPVVA
jgi:hypothetical protein